MKQRLLAVFSALLVVRGLQGKYCLCFGFDGLFCLYGMLLGI